MSRRSHHCVNLAIHLIVTCGALGALSACGGKDKNESSASGGTFSTVTTGGSTATATSGGASTVATGGSSLHVSTGGATGTLSTGGSAATGGSGAALTTSAGTHPMSGGSSSTATGGSGTHPTSGGSSSTVATGGTKSTQAGGTSAYSAGGTTFTGGSQTAGGTRQVGGTSSARSSTLQSGGSSSSGGTSGSALGGDAAVQSFTTSYVTPYCERLADCCAEEGYSAPSAASCASNELSYYVDSLADGSAQPNNEGIATFLGSIATSCDQPSFALMANLTAGTRPTGADCTDVSQCAGSSVACITSGSATVGKCSPLARGASGDPCSVDCDNTTTCRWSFGGGSAAPATACWDEDGLRCDTVTNTCVPLAGVGQACESLECGVHASCVNGKCVAKGKLSESCSDGRSCESTLICNSNHVCEKMSVAYSGNCGA